MLTDDPPVSDAAHHNSLSALGPDFCDWRVHDLGAAGGAGRCSFNHLEPNYGTAQSHQAAVRRGAEKDADEAGIVSDEAVIDPDNSHLPASESGQLAEDEEKPGAPMLEQRVAELPPG